MDTREVGECCLDGIGDGRGEGALKALWYWFEHEKLGDGKGYVSLLWWSMMDDMC